MLPNYLTRIFWRNIIQQDFEIVTFASRDYTNDVEATYIEYTLPRAIFDASAGPEKAASGIVTDTLPTSKFEVYQESLDNATLVSTGLPSAAPPPKVGDRITRADNTVWQVSDADLDRTGQIWDLPVERLM